MRGVSSQTTLLTGAGISTGSQLPDGQKLAAMAFAAVSKPVQMSAACRRAVMGSLKWGYKPEPVRLELLLELMSRDLPLATLAGVYSSVQNAQPTRTHAAIIATRLPNVTANQDELLEAAAANDPSRTAGVLHLHGRASEPASIMTTIGQYSAGLPTHVQQRFTDLIDNRPVLVAGYSGRDLDIMPTLYTARHVTWLHWYPSGRQPAPLTAEAQRLQDHLGTRFNLVPVTNVADWFSTRLATKARQDALAWPDASPPRKPALSKQAKAAFDALDEMDRHVAVARVLMHVDHPAEALRILKPWISGRRLRARAALRAAEAEQMLGDLKASLRLYQAAVDHADNDRVLASAWLGVANVHANTGHYRAALADLDRMDQVAALVTNRRHRIDAQTKSAAARGRIETSTGHDAAAARSYRRAINAATRNSDLGQRLNALVMGADVYRSAGKPLKAIAQLNEAFSDNTIYTRPYSRMWGLYFRGLARCASGDLHGGRADLRDCVNDATRTGNSQAMAWAQVTLSSFYLEEDLSVATRYADACEVSIASWGRMPLAQIRLDWHRAEICRARGDHDAARAGLAEVLKHLRAAPHTYGAPYMTPHVHAMQAEMARAEGSDDCPHLIDRAMAEFRDGGWMQQVARMQVSRWLWSGRGPKPPQRLIDRCVRNDYGLELTVVRAGRGAGYVPLHPL